MSHVRIIVEPDPNASPDASDQQFFGQTFEVQGGRAEDILKLASGAEAADERKSSSQATRLVELASGFEVFHDEQDSAYVTLEVGEHREFWPVRSKYFRDWLARAFFLNEKRAPSAQAIVDALGVIQGRACYEGPRHTVALRVAQCEGCLYLDLCDDAWRCVEIDTDGWRVIERSPVRFIRRRGMLPLPAPVGADTDLLWGFTNLEREQDRQLLLVWLLQALRPTGPYPILIFEGEAASAKTTQARLARAVIDPSISAVRTPPRNVQDLMIAAHNSQVVALDNLSRLKPWLADDLCRLSTGGGFSTRELYSDTEEIILDVQRPVILNGIDALASRSDLADRAIVIPLQRIPETRMRAERELWLRFNDARPAILGGLLSALSGTLRVQSSVRLSASPRMADFAHLGVAAERALAWDTGSFLKAYAGNRKDAAVISLEGDVLYKALSSSLDKSPNWKGSASELLSALRRPDHVPDEDWPSNARALSGRIRRLAPVLRLAGWEVRFDRQSGETRKRVIHIERPSSRPSRSSQPSPEAEEPSNQPSHDGRATVPSTVPGNGHRHTERPTGDDQDGRDGREPLFSVGPDVPGRDGPCPRCAGEGCPWCRETLAGDA